MVRRRVRIAEYPAVMRGQPPPKSPCRRDNWVAMGLVVAQCAAAHAKGNFHLQ